MLQAVATVGFGNAHAKTIIQNQAVKSKIKNRTSYSTEAALAYKGKVGKLFITPKVGVKHGSYSTGGYTQNLEAQSISVAGTRNNKTSMVIGLRAHIPIQVNDTTIVTPELHTEVEKFLDNKRAKLNIFNSNGEQYSLPTEKPAKYSYKFGGSLSVKRGRTEILAIYDFLRTNKKYSSHQGSIKLKITL